MLTLHIISLIALAAILIYIICFICRYRIIPQSLSVTAEWNGRYTWWRIMICTIMGWFSYWYPVVYDFSTYGFYTLLASAGVAGLALSGYYSYSPYEETKQDLTIHKIGSFCGATLICLFYVLCQHSWWVLIVLGVCLLLGFFIQGYRTSDGPRYSKSNSIVFWEEIGIIGIIGYDIIHNFVLCL